MRILFYNWVPFDDQYHRGGGVTVYLHDLIGKFSEDPQYECTFLSSGLEYTFDGKLRIEKMQNCYAESVTSFQIVNSPVHAPACMQFSDLQTYLEDTALLELLDVFWAEQGGFDIVHFHNLEGLSLPVLQLKDRHPDVKFYFSLHNYFLFCPQVNLWTNTGDNCYRSPCFPHCSQCIVTANTKVEKLIASTKSFLNNASLSNTRLYTILKRAANALRRTSIQKRQTGQGTIDHEGGSCNIYSEYRQRNIRYANQYFDLIFAVSRQTSEIAQSYGIRADKIRIDYIGTLAASKRNPPKEYSNEFLHVGFLGYARKDKGFDQLLEALSLIPPQAASRMDILLAAKCETQEQYEAYSEYLKTLLQHFHSCRFMNGYAKSEQNSLLNKIDLGVIPSLWEDNLPQVAIEYIASGVPIVVSDVGGAKELCTNPDFIYSSNDAAALSRKLEEFALCPDKLSDFWTEMPKLMNMDDHVQNLRQYYCQ